MAAAAVRLPAAGARQAARVGVALGSGGRHGLVHVGVIRAFQELGFRPAVITGCSVGAIAGSLWAAGLDADAIQKAALDTTWRDATGLHLPQLGLSNLQPLQQEIDRLTSGARIEKLPIGFAAVATDLADGRSVVLRRGPLGAAVAASSSVPIRYEPVTIDGRRLVDGALTAPVPVDAARVLGADFVLAIDVAYRPYEEDVSGITDVAFQMFHIMVNQLIAEQVRRADHVIRLDVHALMQHGGEPDQLIALGERTVRDAWPVLRTQIGR